MLLMKIKYGLYCGRRYFLWRFAKPDIDKLDSRDLQVCFLELCYIKEKIYTLSPA